MAYYNEIDPFAAQWLENLIYVGEIADGFVDRRSVVDVLPEELVGFTQCHFFAGIGGWSLALRKAGWPDDKPVWTGSCPCQPFSTAGKKQGIDDERHLWPEFYRLIKAQPQLPILFGEQVAQAAGRAWLDGVFADLEASGYACGAADLAAAGVFSPHVRSRHYWVADPHSQGIRSWRSREAKGPKGQDEKETPKRERFRNDPGESGEVLSPCSLCGFRFNFEVLGKYGCPNCEGIGLGNSNGQGLEGHPGNGKAAGDQEEIRPTAKAGTWSDYEILNYEDGKARRSGVQSGSFPVAYGLPKSLGPGSPKSDRLRLVAAKHNRTGRIKGYGNAIVPDLAALFIEASGLL